MLIILGFLDLIPHSFYFVPSQEFFVDRGLRSRAIVTQESSAGCKVNFAKGSPAKDSPDTIKFRGGMGWFVEFSEIKLNKLLKL
jgi:hypothetical protein